MARDKHGIPFHPSEYNPDFPRIKCKVCGLMNSCEHGLTDVQSWFPRLPILLEGGMVESIDDFELHKWTEYSLQRIVDTQIKNHKLIIDNFLHPDLLTFVLDAWPTDMYTIDVQGRLQQDMDCNMIYQFLFDKVINDEYIKCAIADKFALESDYEASAWLWQDSEQFDITGVHVDYDQFNITFGLYLPQDDSIKEYGTQFWTPNEIPDDLEVNIGREECTLIDQVPFIANTIYFMPRTIHSWHSSPILDRPMTRNHVYGYYKSI